MIRPLHDASTHALVTASIAAGLRTAAMLDPEPISKMALTVAAAAVSIFRNAFSGCGQTCVRATQIADSLEPQLRQLRDAYLADPARTVTQRDQVLAVMDAIFEDLRSGCSAPELGDAGRRCISERLVHGGSAPWCPTQTGCDWITLYRDPVADAAARQTILSVASQATSSWKFWAAAAVLTWAVLS